MDNVSKIDLVIPNSNENYWDQTDKSATEKFNDLGNIIQAPRENGIKQKTNKQEKDGKKKSALEKKGPIETLGGSMYEKTPSHIAEEIKDDIMDQENGASPVRKDDQITVNTRTQMNFKPAKSPKPVKGQPRVQKIIPIVRLQYGVQEPPETIQENSADSYRRDQSKVSISQSFAKEQKHLSKSMSKDSTDFKFEQTMKRVQSKNYKLEDSMRKIQNEVSGRNLHQKLMVPTAEQEEKPPLIIAKPFQQTSNLKDGTGKASSNDFQQSYGAATLMKHSTLHLDQLAGTLKNPNLKVTSSDLQEFEREFEQSFAVKGQMLNPHIQGVQLTANNQKINIPDPSMSMVHESQVRSLSSQGQDADGKHEIDNLKNLELRGALSKPQTSEVSVGNPLDTFDNLPTIDSVGIQNIRISQKQVIKQQQLIQSQFHFFGLQPTTFNIEVENKSDQRASPISQLYMSPSGSSRGDNSKLKIVEDDSVQNLQRVDTKKKFMFGFAPKGPNIRDLEHIDDLANKSNEITRSKQNIMPVKIQKFARSPNLSPKFKVQNDTMINRALPFKMSQFNFIDKSGRQQMDKRKLTQSIGSPLNLILNQPSELSLFKNYQSNVHASIDVVEMSRQFKNHNLLTSVSRNTSLDIPQQNQSTTGLHIVTKQGIKMQESQLGFHTGAQTTKNKDLAENVLDSTQSKKAFELRTTRLSPMMSTTSALPFNCTIQGAGGPRFTSLSKDKKQIESKITIQNQQQQLIRAPDKYVQNVKLYQPPHIVLEKYRTNKNRLTNKTGRLNTKLQKIMSKNYIKKEDNYQNNMYSVSRDVSGQSLEPFYMQLMNRDKHAQTTLNKVPGDQLSNSLQSFIITKNIQEKEDITRDLPTKNENTDNSLEDDGPSSNFMTMDLRENPNIKKFNIESIMKVNPQLDSQFIDGRTSNQRSILLDSPDQIRTIQLPEDQDQQEIQSLFRHHVKHTKNARMRQTNNKSTFDNVNRYQEPHMYVQSLEGQKVIQMENMQKLVGTPNHNPDSKQKQQIQYKMDYPYEGSSFDSQEGIKRHSQVSNKTYKQVNAFPGHRQKVQVQRMQSIAQASPLSPLLSPGKTSVLNSQILSQKQSGEPSKSQVKYDGDMQQKVVLNTDLKKVQSTLQEVEMKQVLNLPVVNEQSLDILSKKSDKQGISPIRKSSKASIVSKLSKKSTNRHNKKVEVITLQKINEQSHLNLNETDLQNQREISKSKAMNSRRSLLSQENDSVKKIEIQKRKSIDLRVLHQLSEEKKPVKTQESLSSNNSMSRDAHPKVHKAQGLQDKVSCTMTMDKRNANNLSEINSEINTLKKASVKKMLEKGSKNNRESGMKESFNRTSEDFTKKTIVKYDSQMSHFSKKSNDSGTISQMMKGKDVLSPKIKPHVDEVPEPKAQKGKLPGQIHPIKEENQVHITSKVQLQDNSILPVIGGPPTQNDAIYMNQLLNKSADGIYIGLDNLHQTMSQFSFKNNTGNMIQFGMTGSQYGKNPVFPPNLMKKQLRKKIAKQGPLRSNNSSQDLFNNQDSYMQSSQVPVEQGSLQDGIMKSLMSRNESPIESQHGMVINNLPELSPLNQTLVNLNLRATHYDGHLVQSRLGSQDHIYSSVKLENSTFDHQGSRRGFISPQNSKNTSFKSKKVAMKAALNIGDKQRLPAIHQSVDMSGQDWGPILRKSYGGKNINQRYVD